MIEAQELRAGYRSGFRRVWREVLCGVSFRVPEGSVTGYLGVNGAGKTTTIKVLVGVNPPAGGSVTIGGKPVGTAEARAQLGYFPEAPFFYDGLDALELLDFFGRLSGLPRGERRKRAEARLEEVGLRGVEGRAIRGYSKGMRQRLGLAQALLHDPKLLVLDEPLDGLDPMGRLQLRQIIAAQRERGRTVFFSSHVLSDVEAVADHLIILDAGAIAFEGAPEELTRDATGGVEVRCGLPEGAAREGVLAGAEQRGTSWQVRCASLEAAQEVVDAVRAAGGSVEQVAQERPSLEEYFMQRFGAVSAAKEGGA